MHTIRVVRTFSSAPTQIQSGVTDLVIGGTAGAPVLYAASRAGGGVMAIGIEPSRLSLLDWHALPAGGQLSAPSNLTLLSIGGLPSLLVTGPDGAAMGGLALQSDGLLGSTFSIDGSPRAPISAFASVVIGDETYHYSTPLDGRGLLVTGRLQADGSTIKIEGQTIAPTRAGVHITDLVSATVDSTPLLIAVSKAEASLIAYHLQPDGTPVRAATLGAADGLGLAGPTEMVTATVAGVTYAIVAGSISSSLSVVRLYGTGEMLLTDHVIDTRDTRFQGVGAVATLTVEGQTFVVAGGGDGGVTLFQLIAGGRLVQMGQLVDPGGTAMDNIQALTLHRAGDVLEVFVAGETWGITRLAVDLGPMGVALRGGGGEDELLGREGVDLLQGGGGDDTLTGLGGQDLLVDGEGTDSLYGGIGADTFVLMPDAAVDVIRDFQPGVDRIDLSNWGRVFSLDAMRVTERSNGQLMVVWGDEILFIVSANGLPLRVADLAAASPFAVWHLLAPPPFADLVLRGGGGDDNLQGGGGDDRLQGLEGADRLSGGAGTDTADYSASPVGIRVNLTTGDVSGGHAEGDILSGIEAIIGSSHADRLVGNGAANLFEGQAGDDLIRGEEGDDQLWGGTGADTLVGGTGNDILRGEDGNDLLTGGVGADVIDGGTGFDTVSFADATQGAVADLANIVRADGAALGDRYNGVESIIGSPFADRLFGNLAGNMIDGRGGRDLLVGRNGNDRLYGSNGQDELQGGHGRDSLYGGAGSDILQGGSGRDLLVGGGGFDTVRYGERAGQPAKVDLARSGANGGAAEGDRLIGIEGIVTGNGRDQLLGNVSANRLDARGGDDVVAGRGGADTLVGGSGKDKLYGGDGADRLIGGQGADRLVGGAGFDIADYATGGPVRVDLGDGGRSGGAARGDRLYGIEGVLGSNAADQLTGNSRDNRLAGNGGNDILMGARGTDSLNGGTGDDRLDGGGGNDLLTGGRGADRFVFWSGRDRITDADRSEGDRLLIDRDLFARNLTEAQIIARHARIEAGDLIIRGADGARLVVEDVGTMRKLSDWLDLI